MTSGLERDDNQACRDKHTPILTKYGVFFSLSDNVKLFVKNNLKWRQLS